MVKRRLTFILIVLLAATAHAKKYRIAGRSVEEETLREQYEQIRDIYVLYRNRVVPAEQVGAFKVTFEIDEVIDSRTVLGHAAGKVEPAKPPPSAPNLAARTGKEFTVAETDKEILANISKGEPFAVSLRERATNLPLTGGWHLMLVDSMTYLDRVKQGKIKAKDVGKLRVLYDVTIRFDDFVKLRQKGHVFPELAGK